MATKKTSPKRRKSIAVTNQGKPISIPVRRRRAHSIVPGERLSPKSKARRSLAPRKSILKASLNILNDDDPSPDTTATQDLTTRKSLPRRVSFAEHAYVRLFTKPNNEQNTASPQTSPTSDLTHDPAHVNDENAYPGASAVHTRRASSRTSWGAESMVIADDDTTSNLSDYLRGDEKEDNSSEGEGEGEMEITECLSAKILRKRSLSLSAQANRLPLSQVVTPALSTAGPSNSSFASTDEGNSNISEENDRSREENTQSSVMSLVSSEGAGEADTSLPIEYTVPTGRAMAPASENPVWLALRRATHSGDTQDPCTDEDDTQEYGSDVGVPPHRPGIDSELAEAEARLNAVRMKLGLDDGDEEDSFEVDASLLEQDQSFTNSDDSADLNTGVDEGDRTLNLTGYLNRARASLASQGSAPMDETRIFKSGTFTVKESTTKNPTAAFMPPVARPSPKKRPATQVGDGESARPSPAKKPVVLARWMTPSPKTTPSPKQPAVRRLSPSKRAPFLAAQQGQEGDKNGKEPRGREERAGSAVASPGQRGSVTLKPLELDKEKEKENIGLGLEATEQWAEVIRKQEFADEAQAPISIANFFTMTDIRFMDELTAPRRSLHPTQPPLTRDPADISLAEYVIAMDIDLPQLELYMHVSADLDAWIAKSKEEYLRAEEEAGKVVPELFVEFREADEEGKAELIHQLKLIKVHTQLLARSEWYDWKLQWIEQLYENAHNGLEALEEDNKILQGLAQAAAARLPTLEEEYTQVMRELELEQADVAEIDNCDQDYLQELKSEIAEQDTAVEALKADVSEMESQLKYLQEQLADVDTQRAEHEKAISEAKRIVDVKSNITKSEIARLKAELENLEALHMWRPTHIEPAFFEFIYRERYRVSIPCVKYRPVPNKIDITIWEQAKHRHKDQWSQLSAHWMQVAKERLARATTAPEIVQNLTEYWAACTQLKSQFRLLAVKYPTRMIVLQNGSFKATAKVMFGSQKAKAFISFTFDAETFATWPISAELIKLSVEVAYGPIDGDLILEAVRRRLRQITPSQHHACLLKSCIDAQGVYP